MARPRRIPLFPVALAASLLLHLFTAFGEPLWLWLQSDSLDPAPLIKATQRKLKAQSVETTEPAGLEGVAPADRLLVRLGRRPARPPHGQPPPSAMSHHPAEPPIEPEKPTPRPTPEPEATTPAEVVAATPTPAPTPAAEAAAQAVQATPTPSPAAVAPTPTAVAANAEATPNPTDTAKPAGSDRPILDAAFPRKVDIAYTVKGIIEAQHRWRVQGKRYEIDTRASFGGLAFEWKSEGDIGRQGLRPRRLLEYRNNQPQPKYQADFDWDAKLVRQGEPGKQKEVPLGDNAFDAFSAAYQFALQGDRMPSFEVQILSGRNSYQVPFEIKGETELTLSGRKVPVLVMTGAYKQRRFEFYLAPEWHNLPVRIRAEDGDKTYDMIATDIGIDGKSVLRRIQREARDR